MFNATWCMFSIAVGWITYLEFFFTMKEHLVPSASSVWKQWGNSCRFAHLVITLTPISYSSLTLFCYVRYAAAFALRQRMLHFVQTYEHYMMFEVLEPSWHVMEKSLKTVWYTGRALFNGLTSLLAMKTLWLKSKGWKFICVWGGRKFTVFRPQ